MTTGVALSGIAIGATSGFLFFNQDNEKLIPMGDQQTNPIQNDILDLSLVTNNFEKITNHALVIPEGIHTLTGVLNPALDIHKIVFSSTINTIHKNPFVNCDNIFDVYIPSTNQTFSFSNGLLINTKTKTLVSSFENILGNTLVVPYGVTSINDQAFYGNNQLQSVIVPVQVTQMGNNVFGFCPNLTSLSLPTTFANHSQLGLSNDQYQAIGWLNPSNNQEYYAFDLSQVTRYCDFVNGNVLTIPNTYYQIKGHLDPDMEINKVVFESNSPIKTIPDEAFRNCKFLQAISLPTTLEQIGSYSFSGCLNLQSVNVIQNLTPSLTYLGENAFNNCHNLIDLSLPAKFKTDHDQTHYGLDDYQWKNIRWDGNLTASSFDLSTINQGHPYLTNQTLTIPKTITSLVGSLNPDLKIKTINFETGSTISVIPNNAFLYCQRLETINLPDSIVSIGNSAFQHCTSLVNINLNNRITSFGDYAFSHCDSLTNLTIPTSLVKLGTGCFEFSNKLNHLHFPSTIVDIQPHTFAMCSELSDVSFATSNGLNSVGSYAFYDTKITLLSLNTNMSAISDYAFSGMKQLSQLNIPSHLTSIGKYAFNDCIALSNITIPNTLTSLGKGAFSNCASLTSLTLPDVITTIEDDTFYNCSNLVTLNVAHNLIKIGNNAFNNCKKLSSFHFENSITTIGNAAFKNCASITNASIFNNTVNFGTSVFEGCSSLTNVYIGGNITQLKDKTFKDCKSLVNLEIPANLTTLGNQVFSGCDKLYNLHVQGQASNQSKVLSIPSTLTTFGKNVFENCQGFNTVQFNNTTMNLIPYGMFYNCDALTTVKIPTNITTIGDSAFMGCDHLTTVQNTNTVNSGVPAGWSSIGSSITDIRPNAFKNCAGLINLDLNSKIVNFGVESFLGCNNLRKVKIHAAGAPNTITFSKNIFNKGAIFPNNLIIEFSSDQIREKFLMTACDGFNKEGNTNKYYYQAVHNHTVPIGKNPNTKVDIAGMDTYLARMQVINCNGLKASDLNDGTLVINDYITALAGNFNGIWPILKGIEFNSKHLSNFPESMFKNDGYIESVTFGETSGVTNIPTRMFDTCAKLKIITLSSKIQSIGEAGFLGCADGAVITFNNPGNTRLNGNVFKYQNVYPRNATFRFKTIAARDYFLKNDGNGEYFIKDGDTQKADGYYHAITKPNKNVR